MFSVWQVVGGCLGVLVTTALLTSGKAHAGPSYTVMTGGDRLNCSAAGEGLPADQTSSAPGVSVSHSSSSGSEFEAWYAQANQTNLKTRTRASQGGWNESPARSCASAAAIFTIDDLIFSSATHSFVDVSLSLHYEGTLSAGIEGGNASSAVTRRATHVSQTWQRSMAKATRAATPQVLRC